MTGPVDSRLCPLCGQRLGRPVLEAHVRGHAGGGWRASPVVRRWVRASSRGRVRAVVWRRLRAATVLSAVAAMVVGVLGGASPWWFVVAAAAFGGAWLLAAVR